MDKAAALNKREPPDFGKKKKEEDKSPFITESEFVNINFDLDWPFILKDLAKYLTGSDILKGNRISEADELLNNIVGEELCKE
jgi:hypothetical protein